MSVDPSVLAALMPKAPPPPQAVSVLLISTPPDLPPVVKGEVISIDKSGQVVISTPQGEIVIKTDLALRMAQAVELKLPPIQANSPPIAQLTPQYQRGGAAGEVPLQQILPPPILLDLTAQAEVAYGLPGQISPVLPGYAAPTSVPPATTLFQLLGLELPASLVPPKSTSSPATPNANVNMSTNSGMPITTLTKPIYGDVITPKTAGQAMPQTLEKLQILFIGSEDEATDFLQNYKQPATATRMGMPTGMPATIMMGGGTSAPLLAHLTGLTPQKLPVFEVLPMGIQPTTSQKIATGTQIIVHAPVLMTGEEMQNTKLNAAILVRIPVAPMSPEMQFSLETLPQNAPLLLQMLNDPNSLMPSGIQGHPLPVPKPDSPQFAMQLIASILGLSKGDPVNLVGSKMAEAMKVEHRDQLQKELQTLSGISRDVLQTTEGTKINIPVQMGTEFYLWQLTVRAPERDGSQKNTGSGIDEKPTRFILDLTMSRMGPMQVDGLSFVQSRRLDLIMRTKNELQPFVQDYLNVEAKKVFDMAEIKGSMAFQTY